MSPAKHGDNIMIYNHKTASQTCNEHMQKQPFWKCLRCWTLWSKPKTWLSWGHRLEWWFSMSNRQMYTQVWPFDPLPFINTLPLWLPPVRVSNGSNQLLSARARNPQTVSQHSTLYPMRCISSGWMRNPSVEPEIWWWNHFWRRNHRFQRLHLRIALYHVFLTAILSKFG